MPIAPFQPDVPEYVAIFNACTALCQLAGTQTPDINAEASWQIAKRGCDAVVKLQAIGIATPAQITDLNTHLTNLIKSLAIVATTGNYDDLLNKPSPGSFGITSVGLAMPKDLFTTSAPVTSVGVLTATLQNQLPNMVWAGPAGGMYASTPVFRLLVASDIPSTLPLVAISSLSGNGFVKTSGGAGTLSVDASVYGQALNGATTLDTAPNGAVATALSSVGPTGSHTTVQRWIKFTDATGTVYLPGF